MKIIRNECARVYYPGWELHSWNCFKHKFIDKCLSLYVSWNEICFWIIFDYITSGSLPKSNEMHNFGVIWYSNHLCSEFFKFEILFWSLSETIWYFATLFNIVCTHVCIHVHICNLAVSLVASETDSEIMMKNTRISNL